MNFDVPSFEIPAIRELSGLRQWVVWQLVERGSGKPTKVPFNPSTQSPASTVDRKTWGSFSDACTVFIQEPKYAGIGFVLAPGDGIVAIDLDDCINEKTKETEKWAQDIISQMDSYTEFSPSGKGIHIFAKGTLDINGRRHGKIEVYSAKRYMTVTGDLWDNSLQELREATKQINTLLATFPERKSTESLQLDSFDLSIQPPAVKFEALLENNTAFKKTWQHARPDLADQSLSSYDLSLASLALLAEWTDQEVASLIVQHRLKHGDTQGKAQRQDYIRRTIARAHSNLQRGVTDKDATTHAAGEDAQEMGEKEILSELSSRLNAPIAAVIKRGKSNSMYYLRLIDGREIRIGMALDLNTQRVTRAALIDAMGIVSNRMRPAMWDQTVRLMLSVVIEEDIGDAESAVHIANLILEYTEQNIPYEWDDKEALIIMTGRPFMRKAELWLQADVFRDWLARSNGYRVDKKELILSLREIGCESKAHTRREKGKSYCKYYWGIVHDTLIDIAGRNTTAVEEGEDER